MGYTTEFYGQFSVDPPLNEAEIEYLKKFADTRRMRSSLGPYYVDRGGMCGQAHTPDIINYNSPPEGQKGGLLREDHTPQSPPRTYTTSH